MTERLICPECGASNLATDMNCGLCGATLKTETVSLVSQETEPKTSEKSNPVSGFSFSVWMTIAGFMAAGFLLSYLAITEFDVGGGSKLANENESPHLAAEKEVVLPATLEAWIGIQEAKLKGSTDETIRTVSLAVADSLIRYQAFERAGNWIETVFNLDTTQVSIALKLANLYYDSNRMDLAIRFYQIFLRHNPDNTDARVDMATAMISASTSPMEAVAELKKVLAIDQNHQIANLNLGVLYFRINKFDQAEKYLTQAKRINPENKAGQSASEMLEQIRNMKK